MNGMPKHIAIIMDGNGRWARSRLLPRYVGHREGVKAVRRIVETCRDRGIQALTLFAFSSENWRRPSNEVGLLMDLFIRTLRKEVDTLHRNGIRVRFIGDRGAFPKDLRDLISQADLPEPDLFIRTGGEQRISNFLLWQLAYTELYFTDTLWPAFDEQSLEEALRSYASRQRRFGRTGEQVEQLKGA
jgi:undecaprenyl diphosphate synthase